MLQISRVTKVVKGGKQISFRAVVAVGDDKGKVGHLHTLLLKTLSACRIVLDHAIQVLGGTGNDSGLLTMIPSGLEP